MAMRIALLILALATPVVYGAQHVVGGNQGWSQTTDYATWTAAQTFAVGDTLLFTYDSTHQVDEVNQADYNSCSSSNAIKNYNGGSTTITLTTAGPMYFICPTSGHCAQGMKLSITVGAANGTTPSGSPTAPTGTPPSTVTASPPPPPKSGVASISCNMNNLMFGFLLVFVTMFAYMG
ncbi:uclacyanin-3-like [Quercus lobata]|uniref:Phytocyanin domain-containing protein n=1 Tax=Quercus lobata TaxID=97700 RepID=A0A7N2M237_QUELO|nr:uclacyanin-3-like [Quercus lobata]